MSLAKNDGFALFSDLKLAYSTKKNNQSLSCAYKTCFNCKINLVLNKVRC